jgi:hypothetical protein
MYSPVRLRRRSVFVIFLLLCVVFGVRLFIGAGLPIRHLKNATTMVMNKQKMRNSTTKAKGIQRGEHTHHQDQSILSHSLRTKKIRNRIMPIPIPVPVDVFFLDSMTLSFQGVMICFLTTDKTEQRQKPRQTQSGPKSQPQNARRICWPPHSSAPAPRGRMACDS